jgi:hypothetical protein
MMRFINALLGVLFTITIGLTANAVTDGQQLLVSPQNGKSTVGNDQHHAHVNQSGDHVMGFDHTKTTHHFLLKPDGGVIEVEVNDPKDLTSRNQIRQHLNLIAELFSNGDFTAPMLIHAQTPPGVPIMKELRAEIKYTFKETEKGGLVQIKTANSKAIGAVHKFLRFQIKDHQTGDSNRVESTR